LILCLQQEVDDTLELTVQDQKDRHAKRYTFSHLQDLQSRLMLVAGKAESGNVNVERFTMVCKMLL